MSIVSATSVHHYLSMSLVEPLKEFSMQNSTSSVVSHHLAPFFRHLQCAIYCCTKTECLSDIRLVPQHSIFHPLMLGPVSVRDRHFDQ